jgi:phage protein D
MPDEVDQAITTIYRELESVAELRLEIKVLQDQLKAADQARQISEGQLALERSKRDDVIARQDAEIQSLKQQLHAAAQAQDPLIEELNLLRQHAQDEQSSTQAQLEEMRTLKATLRRILDV